MAENCDATNGAGLSNAPMPGWDSSADCWSVMNISSPPTERSSISPVSGSPCGNVYETRSRDLLLSPDCIYFHTISGACVRMRSAQFEFVKGTSRPTDNNLRCLTTHLSFTIQFIFVIIHRPYYIFCYYL